MAWCSGSGSGLSLTRPAVPRPHTCPAVHGPALLAGCSLLRRQAGAEAGVRGRRPRRLRRTHIHAHSPRQLRLRRLHGAARSNALSLSPSLRMLHVLRGLLCRATACLTYLGRRLPVHMQVRQAVAMAACWLHWLRWELGALMGGRRPHWPIVPTAPLRVHCAAWRGWGLRDGAMQLRQGGPACGRGRGGHPCSACACCGLAELGLRLRLSRLAGHRRLHQLLLLITAQGRLLWLWLHGCSGLRCCCAGGRMRDAHICIQVLTVSTHFASPMTRCMLMLAAVAVGPLWRRWRLAWRPAQTCLCCCQRLWHTLAAGRHAGGCMEPTCCCYAATQGIHLSGASMAVVVRRSLRDAARGVHCIGGST